MKPFNLCCISAYITILFCFSNCADKASTTAQTQPELISFSKIYSAKDFQPVHITNANDSSDRLFITDVLGRVMIYKNGQMLEKPFLDMRRYLPQGDMRLVSIAFHPNFRDNQVFFAFYTDLLGTVYLGRFLAGKSYPDTAIKESGVVIYKATSHTGRVHHHGGDLHFGKDGYLYMAIGYMDKQGDPSRQAQNMTLPFGKVLRFDVNVNEPPYYRVPPDNPFINSRDTLPEIWASGLRNPWRFCFDKETGDFWLGDVGQDKYEEINFRYFTDPPGANFGWNCYEADSDYEINKCVSKNNYAFPVFSYEHNYKTGNSITGGVVYRGKTYPSLNGSYICADFNSKEAWLIKQKGDRFVTYTQTTGVPKLIVGLGEDEEGEVYAAAYDGVIYKLTAANSNGSSASQPVTSKFEKNKTK